MLFIFATNPAKQLFFFQCIPEVPQHCPLLLWKIISHYLFCKLSPLLLPDDYFYKVLVLVKHFLDTAIL